MVKGSDTANILIVNLDLEKRERYIYLKHVIVGLLKLSAKSSTRNHTVGRKLFPSLLLVYALYAMPRKLTQSKFAVALGSFVAS